LNSLARGPLSPIPLARQKFVESGQSLPALIFTTPGVLEVLKTRVELLAPRVIDVCARPAVGLTDKTTAKIPAVVVRLRRFSICTASRMFTGPLAERTTEVSYTEAAVALFLRRRTAPSARSPEPISNMLVGSGVGETTTLALFTTPVEVLNCRVTESVPVREPN